MRHTPRQALLAVAMTALAHIVRQLYEFKNGVRSGPQSAQMKPTVEQLAIEDMIALAAYAASLPPLPQD